MLNSVPVYKQSDPRWGRQLLGTSEVDLADYGCAITCVAMVDSKFDPANPWNPGQVDEWFTKHEGYVNGNLVAWDRINRLLPNTLWQGRDWTPNTPAPIQKIKNHLNAGGLVILEVRFGGNPNLMHFVVGVGFNGDDIIYNDPYVGDTASFANGRFGSGLAYADIIATHYFIDTTPDVPNPPPVAPVEAPVQPAPAPAPETPPADSPEPPANEATPPPVETIPESGKPETPAQLPLPEMEPEVPTLDPPLLSETTIDDWKETIVETLIEFLKGKKTYVVAIVTVIYGLLTGNTDAVLQGLGLAGLRAGVGKLGQ